MSYSHDQIKQLNVLLAEKKESILKYQERISDMQSVIGNLREASLNRQGEVGASPYTIANTYICT